MGERLESSRSIVAKLDSISAGDIAALVGMKGTTTGDTLCDPAHPVVLESIKVPESVISVAIEPKTKADQGKLAVSLQKLANEDPSFRMRVDSETGQTIISGMGELHLEISIEKLKRAIGVPQEDTEKIKLGKPRVFITAEVDGTPDGFRVDVDGNLWCGWGMSETLDGVRVYDKGGEPIGHIALPERCANVCFGGRQRNRLFMAASHSIYALYVNTQGVAAG